MKLTALEVAEIAQTLWDSTGIADRPDGGVFICDRDRRLELANRVRSLLHEVEVECLQVPQEAKHGE